MLSRKYKCVFVRIPKVAGQSIEQVFLGFHGLGWDNRDELLLTPNDNPHYGRIALLISRPRSTVHVATCRNRISLYFANSAFFVTRGRGWFPFIGI